MEYRACTFNIMFIDAQKYQNASLQVNLSYRKTMKKITFGAAQCFSFPFFVTPRTATYYYYCVAYS